MSRITQAAPSRSKICLPHRFTGTLVAVEELLRSLGLTFTSQLFDHSVTFRTTAGDVIVWWRRNGTLTVQSADSGPGQRNPKPYTLDAYFV
jgi:hypothetical protein